MINPLSYSHISQQDVDSSMYNACVCETECVMEGFCWTHASSALEAVTYFSQSPSLSLSHTNTNTWTQEHTRTHRHADTQPLTKGQESRG